MYSNIYFEYLFRIFIHLKIPFFFTTKNIFEFITKQMINFVEDVINYELQISLVLKY